MGFKNRIHLKIRTKRSPITGDTKKRCLQQPTVRRSKGVDLNSEVAVRVRWDKAEDLSLEEYQGMHNAETHAADSQWNTPSKN